MRRGYDFPRRSATASSLMLWEEAVSCGGGVAGWAGAYGADLVWPGLLVVGGVQILL
jgi:hypothetical protein